MATGSLKKMASIDAQLRLIAPSKVSEDDKLVEYDALLLDRFLDILQDLHGEEVREFVQECYEVAADYDGNRNTEKLEELGNMLTSLDPGDSIVVTKSFSNMLSLANLAEEVQIAYRRRIKKLKKGDFADEASATTESDIEETLKRLLQLNKTPEEVFDALKNQTVDLVLTAHPTQSVRRSLLQKFGRIRDCLTQLYAKDITPDDKQELDEALQREIQAAFRTDEIRRTPPTPQDEMRAGMSYFHETIWKGVPKFLRRVDTALKNIGINERVPYNAPLIQFSSWMGGDRDGNPRVTPEVTRDVCLLARMMAANLYFSQIEDLMFEMSMWRCNEELRVRAEAQRCAKRDAKHYIEFWKQIPSNEPYRAILGDVRDKLYNTRERARQLLSSGVSDVPEDAVFTSVDQATPELEYGRMNIGSRPSKRKPSGGIESLRAIPWIFAWTQTRFHLPVWLGFGAAFKRVIQKDAKNLNMLKEMYNQWPFFRVTIDLVEMVFAKGDPGIAALYDRLLVSEELQPFGEQLRVNYQETRRLLLQVAGHKDILEGDPYLRQRLQLRDPYITTLNVCQAYTLKQIRDPSFHVKVRPHLTKDYMESSKPAAELVKLNPKSEYAPGLEDTVILTMKGIAAGMQNTG
ncbi:phosphoenolpyruvate carboxylase 2 isoform X2 [Brassica napus]|uniref:phosphoenolpyruvate carboxylase 2 isoform X2 n=1 Tax=Brassica napus TaxID=3708 RepID=UPI000BBEDEFA|nr:phosphoenolpyruvate carboxylase 2 isoform X2 [Brassica napus]XP_048609299.1 phosphoenolpyruvate carboxylase 2 isoform X2 [Brassica napus]